MAAALPVFSMMCLPIAWRAECGVRPSTPAISAISFQMSFMTLATRRPSP